MVSRRYRLTYKETNKHKNLINLSELTFVTDFLLQYIFLPIYGLCSPSFQPMDSDVKIFSLMLKPNQTKPNQTPCRFIS